MTHNRPRQPRSPEVRDRIVPDPLTGQPVQIYEMYCPECWTAEPAYFTRHEAAAAALRHTGTCQIPKIAREAGRQLERMAQDLNERWAVWLHEQKKRAERERAQRFRDMEGQDD